MDDFLILSGVKGDTRRYRTFHLFEQFQLAGVPCQVSHITDPKLIDKLSHASVVFLHRVTYDAFVEQLFDFIRQRNILSILDSDDLTFNPNSFHWIDSPDFADPIRAQLYQDDLRRNSLTLENCQAAMVSTKYLADQIHTFNKPCWVHRNAYSFEMLNLSEEAYAAKVEEQSKVIIGYASGTATHNRDFSVAKPALIKILQEYPHVELWLIGPIDPGDNWGDLTNRVRHDKLVPWRRLPSILCQFDINIAPLVTNNPFSQSKSEIKYMEAGLVRVPTIASPIPAFNYAIRSGENGWLAKSIQDWETSISELVEDSGLRNHLGNRAYQDVIARYHPQVRSRELISTTMQIIEKFNYPEFETLPHTNQLRDRITQAYERHPTYLEMGFYSIRFRGWKTLLKQIWIYFRRLLAPIFPY